MEILVPRADTIGAEGIGPVLNNGHVYVLEEVNSEGMREPVNTLDLVKEVLSGETQLSDLKKEKGARENERTPCGIDYGG